MPCYTPVPAYRAEGGQIVFSSKAGHADLPLSFPCGKCLGCRADFARSWALRCVHEAQMHEVSSFITLTFDPEFLPADLSINVRHWQLFAKRVRKRLGPFRFLSCGEYGERFRRPHYHACVFGQDFDRKSWKLFRRAPGGDLYTSEVLSSLWQQGFCTIGSLSYESAAYVARYVMKKVGVAPENTEAYRRVNPLTGEEWYVSREFLTMSRRPGIGAGWYDRFKSDVFPGDRIVHAGKRYTVPMFYLRRLETEDPSLFAVVKAKRRRFAAVGNLPADLITPGKPFAEQRVPRDMLRAASLGVALEGSENSPARLSSRLAVDESRLATFTKREF